MIPGAMSPSAASEPPASPPAGPAASPMSNPSEQEGLKAQAAQGLQLAIKLMEASLIPFGSTTPEGKKIMSAINSLAKIAGPGGGPDMNQAEVKMLAAKAGPENAQQQPPGGPAGPAAGGGMKMMGPSPMGI